MKNRCLGGKIKRSGRVLLGRLTFNKKRRRIRIPREETNPTWEDLQTRYRLLAAYLDPIYSELIQLKGLKETRRISTQEYEDRKVEIIKQM